MERKQGPVVGDDPHGHEIGLYDTPARRALQEASRQAQRARRAEIVRQRQREVLLELIAQTMADLHISMAELGAARRALALRGPDDAHDAHEVDEAPDSHDPV
jgi:hypothetical protein